MYALARVAARRRLLYGFYFLTRTPWTRLNLKDALSSCMSARLSLAFEQAGAIDSFELCKESALTKWMSPLSSSFLKLTAHEIWEKGLQLGNYTRLCGRAVSYGKLVFQSNKCHFETTRNTGRRSALNSKQ